LNAAGQRVAFDAVTGQDARRDLHRRIVPNSGDLTNGHKARDGFGGRQVPDQDQGILFGRAFGLVTT